ncbi:MAG: bifunctional 3-(3-hydroxy-phenyl)propionate/3-hydroxycinnamic acid hydroxylase, partial [Mycobacterium sp.]
HLDDVLGSGFAVITSQALSPGDRAEAERCGATVYLADPDSEVGHWLGRGRATTAIVRPDHTVLRAGREVSRLLESLRSIS